MWRVGSKLLPKHEMDCRLVRCARAKPGRPESWPAKKRSVTAYLENWIKHEADKARKSCYSINQALKKALLRENCNFENRLSITWSSYKERKGNALAPGAEEGRDKLRKAAGSRK